MAQFTNQAQLVYGNTITNSNIAIGEVLEVLSATKTAVRNNYSQNDTVTYIISIINAGTMAYTGLTITDNLGAYDFNTTSLVPLTYVDGTARYYVNGTLLAAPAVTAGPPLTISGITVPAGGNATIIYEADVNSFAPLGGASTITNEAVISGGGITPITTTETITADREALLNITKSISPVPVAENGILTYTFVIQNLGSADAVTTDNAVITDIFNPILTDINVSYNGVQWAEGTDYTYDEATGVFRTVAGRVVVPAATFEQNQTTGVYVINPGVSTLVISGTI